MAASIVIPGTAIAEPRAGAPFPPFRVRALDDAIRTERDLRGHRSIVVTITGLDAADDTAQWLNLAEARFGRGLGTVYSFVALRLGFYALDGLVRSETRRHSPRDRWPYVYIDRDGDFQRQLGLPNDERVPWVYVVEPNGIVSVAVHTGPSAASVQRVWAQMTTP